MKRVLICGGGVMQLPAIRIAHDLGYYVIVADGNAECAGHASADRFEQVDLNDLSGMVRVAKRYSVDGVFTAGTDFSTTVAWVADTCGLPGIPYATALRAKDKILMRQRLSAGGVQVPPFAEVSAAHMRGGNLPQSVAQVPLPAVAKPVDNMGARGVSTVTSSKQIFPALSKAIGASRTGRAIFESFIPGPEFSVDAISYRGSVTICGIADRHISFAPFFVETGHTIPSSLTEKRRSILEEHFAQAVRVLGIDPGAAKGDIFLVPRGDAPNWLSERLDRQSGFADSSDIVVIGEIAARLSGGYMSGWTYPYARGWEPTRAALQISVGEEPDTLRESRRDYCAERAIISIPGRIRHFPCQPFPCEPNESDSFSRAAREDTPDELFLTRQAGDRVQLPTNNVEKCGNIIAAGPTYEEAARRAESLRYSLRVRLEVNDLETERFLFGARDPEHVVWQERGRAETPSRRRALRARLLSQLHAYLDTAEGNEMSAPPEDYTPATVDYGTDEALRDERDHCDARRSQIGDFISKYLNQPPSWTISVHSRDLSLFRLLALIASERGGLQGAEYLIDTVEKEGGMRPLWNRICSLYRG